MPFLQLLLLQATPTTIRQAAPVPAKLATPASPPAPAQPANILLVFQLFGQQTPRPASTPVQTPVNPNAFSINPVKSAVPPPRPQAAAPAPVPQRVPVPQPSSPQRIIPQQQIVQSQLRPTAPAAPRPVQPQAACPVQFNQLNSIELK